ncbi:MAG: KilA-N domain-containing protein [Leptothrix sp. (in: b-proteobacteria)]
MTTLNKAGKAAGRAAALPHGSTSIIHADFGGTAVDFRADGWFNATQAAARFGRLPNEWLRLPSTAEYIAALDDSNAGESRIWVKTARGNSGGTWMHPDLAVAFARWLDVRFGIWCDRTVRALLLDQQAHQSPDWQQARREVAQEFRHVAEMLQDVRADAGKPTAAHHFINEARLIRHAMTGDSSQPLDRNSLLPKALRLLGAVERLDMRLLAKGTPYAERKTACRALVLSQQPLIGA